jgi:hypothetical protein
VSCVDGKFISKVESYDIIWADVLDVKFEFSFIHRKGKGKSELVRQFATISPDERSNVQEWCDAVMLSAYAGECSGCGNEATCSY